MNLKRYMIKKKKKKYLCLCELLCEELAGSYLRDLKPLAGCSEAGQATFRQPAMPFLLSLWSFASNDSVYF